MGNGISNLRERLRGVKDFAAKLYKGTVKWFVLPMVGTLLAIMIFRPIANTVVGVGPYHVYVVGNLEDHASKQVMDGFVHSPPEKIGTIDGIEVDAVRRDDRGDPENARRIASELANASDTLMVVGHILSTETKAALPVYLGANPPVPVILTTETNPQLLPPKTSEYVHYPVYRLSPDDNQQAQQAAHFAARHGARRIWVVEDSSNPVYSSYLAQKFISDVHKETGTSVLLWSSNLDIPPPAAIKALHVDWVFFAGYWEDALILIRQLKAILPASHILLSDYCVDHGLIAQGGKDVENAYLTFQLSARKYNEEGYANYGLNARTLITQLLQEANNSHTFSDFAGQGNRFSYWVRKILGIHRISDARKVVGRLMQEGAASGHVFQMSDGSSVQFSSKDGSLVTNNDGTLENEQFHVWQIRNGQFVDAQ